MTPKTTYTIGGEYQKQVCQTFIGRSAELKLWNDCCLVKPKLTITCRGDLWAMQDVKNTEISVLVCCVFEGSIIIGCGCDFTKVELHAKLGCEFASPLEANGFFSTRTECM